MPGETTKKTPTRKDKMRSIVRRQVGQLSDSKGEDNLIPIHTIAREAVRKTFKADAESGTVLLKAIDPDPDQVRTVDTSTEAFQDLVRSIAEHGVLQPITVRWIENRKRFQVITGERRYRAARKASLERIPAIIKDVDDTKKSVQQLVENIQRENLNPVQEAKAFERYLAATKKTHAQLARDIGKDRTYVTKALSILEGLTIAEQAQLEQCAPANMPAKDLILEALRTPDKIIRAQILSGTMTRSEARTTIKEQSPTRSPGRKRSSRRSFASTKVSAVVSVVVKKTNASDEEILTALEDAVEQQRAKLQR